MHEIQAACGGANFYEDTLEAMHQRATSNPVWMKQRRSIVEHPFGTIKWMMGTLASCCRD
jgi:hypothetical protein